MKKSIKLMRFPSEGWGFERRDESIELWSNELGDAASLNYIDLVPNIPATLDPENIEILRNWYRQLSTTNGSGIVSVDLITQAGINGLEVILKHPQNPSGMSYIASITFPFSDFSFVIKFTCPEIGDTGFRDAVVADKLSASFKEEETSDFKWWRKDPYDSKYADAALYNLSDREEFDSLFPNHPLSRARGYLRKLKDSLSFDNALLDYPKFKAGKDVPSPWWKLW
jgi:hypothetical protein